jgi:hypothetical protein
MQKNDNREKLARKIRASINIGQSKKEPGQLSLKDLLNRKDLAPDVRECLIDYERRLTTRFEKEDKAEADFICEVIRAARWEDSELPETVTAIVQNYMREMAKEFDLAPWSNPEIARAAYKYIIDAQSGSLVFTPTMSFRGLRMAAQALCTAAEWKLFFTERDLNDDEPPMTRDEKDYEAALKAACLLADPRTPAETRNALQGAVCDFANATDVQIDHPALVERALTIMFESMKKRVRKQTITPNRREAYTQLVGLLKTAEEGGAK